jgi:hypothetical protein
MKNSASRFEQSYSLGKEPLVPTAYEAWWSTESDNMVVVKKNLLPSTGIETHAYPMNFTVSYAS